MILSAFFISRNDLRTLVGPRLQINVGEFKFSLVLFRKQRTSNAAFSFRENDLPRFPRLPRHALALLFYVCILLVFVFTFDFVFVSSFGVFGDITQLQYCAKPSFPTKNFLHISARCIK